MRVETVRQKERDFTHESLDGGDTLGLPPFPSVLDTSKNHGVLVRARKDTTLTGNGGIEKCS